ncbi:uncharacterized protein [Primulina eburnea]|uniref:uncharacterized protein n=1 Tax=Primulina eburnea TaxID=1245227 RepID=UPI003C6BF41A
MRSALTWKSWEETLVRFLKLERFAKLLMHALYRIFMARENSLHGLIGGLLIILSLRDLIDMWLHLNGECYILHHVQSLDFYHSDHRPIIIEFGRNQQLPVRSSSMFRLEQHWATEPDFGDVVYMGWDKNNCDITLPNRLKRCKETLKAWAGNRFGKIPQQLISKRKQLATLRTHEHWHESTSRIRALEREVEDLATKNEVYWKQRSRVNWLAHGDRNSKYFHACVSARRTNNFISGLVSAHGDCSNNPTENEKNTILSCVPETIDEQVNDVLCALFSTAEVRKALFDMHPEKAPGPDVMSVFFYQKLWDVIGDEVTVAILKILNQGETIDDWNDTIVTLVPKIQHPMTMKDFA